MIEREALAAAEQRLAALQTRQAHATAVFRAAITAHCQACDLAVQASHALNDARREVTAVAHDIVELLDTYGLDGRAPALPLIPGVLVRLTYLQGALIAHAQQGDFDTQLLAELAAAAAVLTTARALRDAAPVTVA